MEIVILSKQHKIDAVELAQIKQAYERAVDRFGHMLEKLEVQFSDLNGPKGGVDQHVRVMARCHPRGSVLIRHTADSIIAAAFESAGMLRRALSRRSGLQRQKQRSSADFVSYREEI